MRDLSQAEYEAFFTGVERVMALCVSFGEAGDRVIVLDPDPATYVGGVPAAELVSVTVYNASARDYIAERNLRTYGSAVLQQLLSAARKSYADRLDAAESDSGLQFAQQGSIATVATVADAQQSIGVRSYTLYDPIEGASGTPILTQFVPGSVAGPQVEAVRAQLDTALNGIDALTGSVLSG
ncbi:MAG: hypothetical protein AAFR96_12285 [Planctomycetota bacterium]